MVIERGDIWWASLPDSEGSEPGYRRPVLVVQSDQFNSSRINTVVVVAITGNVSRKDATGNVYLSTKTSGLPRASVINVSQIVTIDKILLTDRVGRLGDREMAMVDTGLGLVLSL
ncbi:MAG: type II toxin-antitoxin system PemK/MazF family toxin [Pirellulales bacterium]|nr:type II toxin-antitoxin system PemK/MazF family toxin [Pirellulales bacterium]